MHRFTDSTGAEWILDLTIGDVDRIRKSVGVDLLDASVEGEGDENFLERLQRDPILACRCLFFGLDVASKGISEEDFLSRLKGSNYRAAVKCFWEGLADFFQSIGRETLAVMTTGYYEEAVEAHKTSVHQARELMKLARQRARKEQEQAFNEARLALDGESSTQLLESPE